MDIALIRTFIEVAATGSFVAASDRLYVTQSAVSLRIQRLEDALGKPLFKRSKAGAELTLAGRQFERYALSMLRVWEEARQQVGVPEGFTKSLTIGAQYSLWPRLGFRWIDAIQTGLPHLNIRAELGMADRLTRFLIEGAVQIGLLYTPQLRPGLQAQRVLDEELVLAASWDARMDTVGAHYVFVDWGPEFVFAHSLELPELTNPGRTLALGAMAADYVIRRKAAAYLPARYIKPELDAGRLHLVPDAPRFPYPIWSVWREDLDPEVRETAEVALTRIAGQIKNDQSAIIASLAEISDVAEVDVLGTHPHDHAGPVDPLPGTGQ